MTNHHEPLPQETSNQYLGIAFFVSVIVTVVSFFILVEDNQPNFTLEEQNAHIKKCIEVARADYPEYKEKHLQYLSYDGLPIPSDSDVGFNRCNLIACNYIPEKCRENSCVAAQIQCDGGNGKKFSFNPI